MSSVPAKLQTLGDEDTNSNPQTLNSCVRQALDRFFAQLDGEQPHELYTMVLREVEAPMLERVMYHLRGNQTKAAQALGISRSTLRKKLALYDLE